MVTKTELKNMFRTGSIPTGQSFATFIDAFVSYVDGKIPDNTGNVNTDFKVVSNLAPTVGPSGYPEGASEFFTDYNKNEFAAYIADNPNFGILESGHLLIRTLRPKMGREVVQHVYNIQDGEYNDSFVRVGDLFDDMWGDLKSIIKEPSMPGGGGGGGSVDIIDNLDTQRNDAALSARQGYQLKQHILTIDNMVDVVNSWIDDHESTWATEETLGHVRYDNDSIKAYHGLLEVDTQNNFSSYSTKKPLSAGKGKELNDRVTNAENAFMQHVNTKASILTEGHVKVDGETITINSSGVISANSSVQTATPSRFGTVKPDGVSLAINESGALYQPQQAGMFFRNTVTTVQTGRMIPWDYYQYLQNMEGSVPPFNYVQLKANRFYRLTAQLGVDRASTGYADFQFARFNGTEGLGQSLTFLTSGVMNNTRVLFENSYSGIWQTNVQLDIIYYTTEAIRVGVMYLDGTGDIRVLPYKSRFLFQEL